MIYKIINWFKEGWKGALGVFMVFQVINHFRNTPDYIKYTINGKWIKVRPKDELLFLKGNPDFIRDSETPVNLIDIFYSWLIDTLPHWFLKSLPDWFLSLPRIVHLICLFVFIYSLIWFLKKIVTRTKNSYTESEEYISNEEISEEEFSYQEEKSHKKYFNTKRFFSAGSNFWFFMFICYLINKILYRVGPIGEDKSFELLLSVFTMACTSSLGWVLFITIGGRYKFKNFKKNFIEWFVSLSTLLFLFFTLAGVLSLFS